VNLRVKLVYNHRHSTTEAAFLPLFIGPDAGTAICSTRFRSMPPNPVQSVRRDLVSGRRGTAANYSTDPGGASSKRSARLHARTSNTFSGTVTVDARSSSAPKKMVLGR